MASPSGGANPSGHLFKPAGYLNPIPAAAGGGAGISSSPFPPTSSFPAPPPPAGAFSYPSSSGTPPPLHYHHHLLHRPYLHYPHEPIDRPRHPFPPSPHLPNHGARLMALLNPTPATFETAVSMPPPPSSIQWSEFLGPPSSSLPYAVPSAPTATLTQATSAPVRLPSNKLPRGRMLGGGDRATYDVDSRFPGETQPPQLEVTPITKYISDPELVLGRQIAVNRSYICYGLKLGAIRVLNINTALRSLLKGHTQRVTDMIFFAEDVHLLASASIDGRIFVWKIDEGPDEENKPQITGEIIIAFQIIGDGVPYHPRICWHSHKQEILFVGIGNHILKIDTNKVGRGREFSEEPLRCSMEELIDGVQSIGKHEADITDLSISQWMTTRLASASKDGMVKIWDGCRVKALSTLRPYDGSPVNMVSFITSPHRPDHINLITAGPLNRELKIWAPVSEEGWLLPSDSELWQCNQSLDLRSSLIPQVDEAFFNQILVLPRAGLIVIANAKKNAIYTVHVEYGSCPSSTNMDFIADFAVTMPVLSLTGITDFLPAGEQVVQVYCVQTQAIQQYALDLIQCLPPRIANAGNGHTDGGMKMSLTTLHPINSTPFLNNIHGSSSFNIVAKPSAPPFQNVEPNILQVVPSFPLNPDLVGGITAMSPHKSSEKVLSLSDHDAERLDFYCTVDRGVDSVVTKSPGVPTISESKGKDNGKNSQDNVSVILNPHLTPKLCGNLTRLITPTEISSGAIAFSESFHDNKCQTDKEMKAQDGNNDSIENVEVEVKVVGEGGPNNIQQRSYQTTESDLELENKCSTLKDTLSEKELADGIAIPKSMRRVNPVEEGNQDGIHGTNDKMSESADAAASQSFAAIKMKLKGKPYQNSIHSSNPLNSTGSLNEPGSNIVASSSDAALPHILSMQETLNQLMSMQRDMQKQMNVAVGASVTEEGKRLETVLRQYMENTVKANMDALWTRFQEENAKREMVEKERIEKITIIVTNCINKDLPAMMEKALTKEISSVGSIVVHAVSPLISSAITESFQRGVGDKAVNQLEKSIISKLEVAVARQIQSQFQTSGKQTLNDALRSCLESTVPAFEKSCKLMFEQVDNAFRKGMHEHRANAQQQLEAAHTPLALMLRDAMNSASSVTQNITTELIDGQRKLLALVAAGNTAPVNPVGLRQANGSNGRMADMLAVSVQQAHAPLDPPTKELSRLIIEHKYEEAFTIALQRSDVAIVSWLCTQVDLHAICSTVPLPLSQGVLLALLQQLACSINTETTTKLSWMTDVAVAINPTDPMITLHVRPIFEQVYNILAHQRSFPTIKPSEATSITLIMHVLNSVLISCK